MMSVHNAISSGCLFLFPQQVLVVGIDLRELGERGLSVDG
jgi:hypothetical protein